MITNPEYLPKDRLKQELKRRGISFGPNENKDYYVNLYREKVMGGKAAQKMSSEFSSDEEFAKQSPRLSKKQQKHTPAKSKKTAPKIDTFLPQVETLSDKALTEQLQEYGESVGPITSTTRSVYERKLAKLIATSDGSRQPAAASHEDVDHAETGESFIGEWSGEESDTTEDSEAAPPPKQHVEKHSHVIKKRHIREERHYVSSPAAGSKGVEQTDLKRRHKPSSSSSSKPSKRPHPGQPTSCSNIWSIICSVLLLMVMFAIAFLVYEHYTRPEEQDSLILMGWKKAGVLVVELREMILKETEPSEGGAEEKPTEAEPQAKKKKRKKGKGGEKK